MTSERSAWAIVSGSSKFDWIDALAHRKYPGAQVELVIMGELGEERRRTHISLISKKSDPGVKSNDPQLWGFYGQMDGPADSSGHQRDRPVHVVGEYSTSERRGTVWKVDPDKFYQQLCILGLR